MKKFCAVAKAFVIVNQAGTARFWSKASQQGLHADGEIEVICPPRLELLKVMRPQNIWFFLAAGEAGVRQA